jgi:TPR repeat protein
MRLIADNGATVSCLTSQISNGKTTDQKAVTYATIGLAGAALALTGLASLGSASAGPNSGSAHAPSFADVIQWFQFIAISGVYSVNYPPLYRNFAKNFAWSTGLVSWDSMQIAIDNFRSKTGGNLTDMSYQYLQNATLVYTAEGSISNTNLAKRDLDFGFGSGSSESLVNSTQGGPAHVVSGIEAFAESLLIPSAKYPPPQNRTNIVLS